MGEYLKGLTHKAYRVKNMEESLKFYSDCLGLEKMFELKNEEGKDWLFYLRINDDQFIELFYDGKTPAEIDMGEHICFEVEDIQKTVDRIRTCGYQTMGYGDKRMKPVQGKDHNLECFIVDPDNNLIELMQFGKDALQHQKYPHPVVI